MHEMANKHKVRTCFASETYSHVRTSSGLPLLGVLRRLCNSGGPVTLHCGRSQFKTNQFAPCPHPNRYQREEWPSISHFLGWLSPTTLLPSVSGCDLAFRRHVTSHVPGHGNVFADDLPRVHILLLAASVLGLPGQHHLGSTFLG